eukprot:8855965-Pyramimonas_sp.AAC.1
MRRRRRGRTTRNIRILNRARQSISDGRGGPQASSVPGHLAWARSSVQQPAHAGPGRERLHRRSAG